MISKTTRNTTRNTIIGLSVLAAICIVSTITPAYAEFVSPYQQTNDGIPHSMIQCNPDKVLMISPTERPACVYESTAEKLEMRGWGILNTMFKTSSEDNTKEKSISILNDAEISTKRITVAGEQKTSFDIESTTVPRMYEYPWTTLTYPEEFKIGEPFVINYTWTFLKSYSEANGDEWPQDNLEKYPWAQHWQPYQEGEDENGKIWWTIKRGHENHPGSLIKMRGNIAINVLTEGFGPHDWKGEPHFPLGEDEPDLELLHPWDLEEHSASVILQLDEQILPPNHWFAIDVAGDQDYVFFVHFNEGIGYLGPSSIKWFESNTFGASGLAEENLSNPYVCWTDEKWNRFSDEQKRWEYVWPSTDCVGKSRDSSNTGLTPSLERQIEGAVNNYKDWIDRNGITENIKEYLKDSMGADNEEIERFFEKYPHLKGLFILPSFSFLPDAFATHGSDHLLVARGIFLVSDVHGNPMSPIGSSVCLYDQRDDGDFKVLKN